ncbi:MAG: three-Cys-motif partner protein TcmP [Candidatus Omnitrophota bacterium]
MALINTESTFFQGKRPWSKIKDSVLKDYLPPYLNKVAQLKQQIILVDAFAGPGIFENETGAERLGSPLIILNAAEKHVPGKYFAIFVNSNKVYHAKLENVISKLISRKSAQILYGTAQELLTELNKIPTNQTLFVYLDPFGLKNLDFKLIEPFLKRNVLYSSTEILINMSMPTLHRLATRNLQQNGNQTSKSIKLNETLTKVLGGDYWKEIMWSESLNAEDKEIKVVEKYRELLKKYLSYTGSCPVREKQGNRIKYFITFCSRHPDAMLLMNDFMCKSYFKYMHERDYVATLFKNMDWKKMRNLSSLKKIILEEINSKSKQTRIELWGKIMQNNFMKYHSSEYKEAVKQIVDEGKIKYENPKNTGRLNDDCILFLNNKSYDLNDSNGLLVGEKAIEYLQIQNRIVNKIKIQFDNYKTLDGGIKYLVKQVNDGSIITRFDKTPLPQVATDVICPHFVELKWAYGCPFDCSWCYLKGTFRFRPEGIKPVVKDFGKVKSHVEAFLNEVKEPEILNTGELADSLMMENGAGAFSKTIIPLFESQDKHKVLFVTKSSNIKNLLEINPHRQVIVSFTLNALAVSGLWEKKAPKVLDRIKAAGELSKAGYEVRIRIDPMVPIENWPGLYHDLIDKIFLAFKPERITLGSLRGLQSTINGTKDTSWVHYLKETSNWGKKIDFTTRMKMYSEITSYLKKEHRYGKIALCKETKAMWQKLGMDYEDIKCNCVW